MRASPRSPTAKTNGSSREGNRIINPHSRIPKSTNKQTNMEDGSINFLFANLDRLGQDDDTLLSLLEDHCYHHYPSSYYSSSPLLSDFCVRSFCF